MRLRHVGLALITTWLALQLLLALGILVSVIVLRRPPPSLELFVEPAVRSALHPQVRALIDGLAVFANACAAAFCGLALPVTWYAVRQGARWALTTLSLIAVLLLAAGFASDALLGNQNVALNVVSSGWLAGGLALVGVSRRAS